MIRGCAVDIAKVRFPPVSIGLQNRPAWCEGQASQNQMRKQLGRAAVEFPYGVALSWCDEDNNPQGNKAY
jgi:hypothetical protein